MSDPGPAKRLTVHREVEMVAICHDHHGEELGLSVTVSHAQRGMIRVRHVHDATAAGLADALVDIADWIRKGVP